MCTVTIKINESLLRGMRPELKTTAAGTVDLETFRADLHNMVDEIYDKH